MISKQYLKMADVFRGGERQSDMDGIGVVIDAGGVTSVDKRST